VVCGGWMFWANRVAANKPTVSASDFLIALSYRGRAGACSAPAGPPYSTRTEL
jgi:hypothetical protein